MNILTHYMPKSDKWKTPKCDLFQIYHMLFFYSFTPVFSSSSCFFSFFHDVQLEKRGDVIRKLMDKAFFQMFVYVKLKKKLCDIDPWCWMFIIWDTDQFCKRQFFIWSIPVLYFRVAVFYLNKNCYWNRVLANGIHPGMQNCGNSPACGFLIVFSFDMIKFRPNIYHNI